MAALRPAVLDRQVFSLDVARVAQSLVECGGKWCIRVGRGVAAVADHRHRLLLRTRRELSYGCTANEKDQLAAPHRAALRRRPQRPRNTAVRFSVQAFTPSLWSSEALQTARTTASASRSSVPAAVSLIARFSPVTASGALAARVAASASARGIKSSGDTTSSR